MLPDVTSPETYGPPLEDYDVIVDPETEISATKMEAWAVDTAALTHVAPRAWVLITGGSSPVVSDHDAVWGGTEAVKPTVSRTGSGEFVITWADSYDDLNPTVDRRVERNINIRTASVTMHSPGGGTVYPIRVERTSNKSVTVTCSNGTNYSDATFTVWIY